MPRRSNAFQTTVYVINTALADDSAIVTESHELTDVVSGKPREVDITIQSDQSGYPFTIGIECRDRVGKQRRPQDVTFVEQVYGKHQFLPINLTVLVSSTGFTRGALDKAKLLRMLTLTTDELTEDRARDLLYADEQIYLCQTEYTVDNLFLDIEPCECHNSAKLLVRNATVLFFADGTQYRAVSEHITELSRLIGGPEKLFLGTSSPHRIGISPVFAPRAAESPVETLYVKVDNRLHEINRIVMGASSTEDTAPIDFRYGVLRDISYGAADVEIGDNRVSVVATVREGEVDNVTLRRDPKRQSRRSGTAQ